MTERKYVINAVDLGWGWTKYSKFDKAKDCIVFGMFPSLAPRHAGVDLSLSLFGRRDTVVVSVNGIEYEVGPDSSDLDVTDATRNLNDQFIYTDQYKAVLYGALHYIGEPVIDFLVVGLPLSSMGAAQKLKDMVVGKHEIRTGEFVEVKDALVLPQPLGGLYQCLSLPEFSSLREETNLVIDPGFLTFDFILANGDKVVENRSNAHAGGVSKVLRAAAESISRKFNIKYDNLGAIDKGMRKGSIKINGVAENLAKHLKVAQQVMDGSVNYMKNIVGDGADIDNIILLGGGAPLFKSTIQRFYPNHRLVIVEDAQMANVKGFQKAGEAYTELF